MRVLGTWFLSVGLLLLPGLAHGYSFITVCGSTPAHWAPGNPNTVWHFSSDYPSTDLPASTVQSLLNEAFNEWSAPGCSEFTASFGGNTTGNPLGSGSQDRVGFLGPGQWPAQYGSTTLAVTQIATYQNCAIAEAAMVFNEEDWVWVDGNPSTWSEADLQAVATHEAGHWVGLGHTNHPNASMQPSYSGGTIERTLSCDDTEGVCVSHPSGGNTCSADNYCPCGVGCDTGGTCDGEPPDPGPDPGGSCDGGVVTETEPSPNAWGAEPVYVDATHNGTVILDGTVPCGHDQNDYTEDLHYFYIHYECIDEARFVLDWNAGPDVDFYVWNPQTEEDIASYYQPTTEGPVHDKGDVSGAISAAVACWEGGQADYTFTVEFQPWDDLPSGDDGSGGNGGGDGGDGDGDGSGGDDGGADDGDGAADKDEQALEEEEAMLACGCRSVSPGTVGFLPLLLVAWLFRRRDLAV